MYTGSVPHTLVRQTVERSDLHRTNRRRDTTGNGPCCIPNVRGYCAATEAPSDNPRAGCRGNSLVRPRIYGFATRRGRFFLCRIPLYWRCLRLRQAPGDLGRKNTEGGTRGASCKNPGFGNSYDGRTAGEWRGTIDTWRRWGGWGSSCFSLVVFACVLCYVITDFT